ncbi:serine/threonine-protein kinase [Streptomyces sp. D2-8]|uniref:serine/threonine protein kinase n=1 Tax=Streptomyces sp. D2-8 TaxID=2707767 RepID=UPI0020BF3693|nr:serine/threonine-protein kinase [Streptomyces sp. D2-8]
MGLREVWGARDFQGCTRVLAGRYRLDALIGSGGSADVHRGFDLRLRRPVAVKVFRAGTGFDTEDAFRGEAVILARLQHPGLVTAFDAGQHDGDAFLVMQLIDGPTLKSRIAEAPLSCEAAAALGAALADALAHAHEAGIVHRDVKPSNIILDSSGHPHLTDFGISRLLDATTRTATGTLTGTAAYLSPEQVLGRPVGRPADIYALGLVLLESLTGRLEYDGGPLEAAIARLHRRPDLPDFLPDGFATLLRDMTSLEEQDRPMARHCAQALTRLAGTSTTTHAAPGARPALSVTPPAAEHHADTTHQSSSPAAKEPWTSSASAGIHEENHRSGSVRGRLRTRGAAAALAALAAAGLIVTDGFSHPDAADTAGPEAAPSAPDQAAPPIPSNTPAHNDDTPSASAAPPSHGPSTPAQPLSEPLPTRTRPAIHPASTPNTSEQATPIAAGKGRAKTPPRPPGEERTNQMGKKAAHAK